MKKPCALIILDGFGYRKEVEDNAIAQAHMPNYRSWLQHYPHTLLAASGAAVGLPADMPGNSLVGHATLGAGRVLKQPITLLLEQIASGDFFRNPELLKKCAELKQKGTTLHLMGLLSDAGNHSHEDIAHALIRMASGAGIKKIVVHAFLDGRDVPPRSAATYLQRLDTVLAAAPGARLGSIMGRAYPMDRTDTRGTITKAFELLTKPHEIHFGSWEQVINAYYAQGITDEFIPPTGLDGQPLINDGDGLIFWNTRADRALLLTELFMTAHHPQLLWFITGIPYAGCAANALVEQQPVADTLLHVFRTHNIRVGSFCESEKFAHVTYFFNGGHELTNPHDLYVVVPSPAPAELESHPEMAARDSTHMVLCSLESDPRDFYVINYANADMLGHTGNFEATVRALEIVDEELGKLYHSFVEQRGGRIYLTADHGNAEFMGLVYGQVHKGHTTNPVPFMVLDKKLYDTTTSLPVCELADVAPYILQQEQLPVPAVMKR